jgi:C4-dicarboxylate-specific signal transduction histidine kinase
MYTNPRLLWLSAIPIRSANSSFKSIDLKEELADLMGIADSHNNLGFVYIDLENYEAAIEAFEASSKINESINNLRGLAANKDYLGDVFVKREDYENAIACYISSIKLYDSLGLKRDMSYPYLDLGAVYYDLRKYDSAIFYLEKSIAYAQNSIPDNLASAFQILSQLYEERGDYLQAYTSFKKYKSEADSMRNDQLTKELAKMEAEYAFQKERLRLDQELKQQRANTFILIVGVVVLIVVIFILINYYQLKQKANNELLEKNKMIADQNVEIKTQKEHLEQTLKELKDTQSILVQSEKMASLGMFSAGISHEINNALNFIQGGVTMINQHVISQSEKEQYLNAVNEGINRILSVIQSLHYFTGKKDEGKQVCDLEDILANCLTIMTSTVKNRVTLQKSFPGRVLVLGERSSLHQLFLILLTNADAGSDTEDRIVIELSADDSNLKMVITDGGKKGRVKEIPSVISSFLTSTYLDQSKVLGYSVAQTIAEEHNGKLEVIMNENETYVLITIPKAQTKDEIV